MKHPRIIQGGMGVAISGWLLARVVAMLGQVGIVSGVAIGRVLARILQLGGPEADIVIAIIKHFPFPGVADRIIEKYYRNPNAKVAKFGFRQDKELEELTVCAAWTWVTLAKINESGQKHNGIVGINLLTKIALPTAPTLYGAMLAGVDRVYMGAGVPKYTPGMLEAFSKKQPAVNGIPIHGERDLMVEFDPRRLFGNELPNLSIPDFFIIISTHILAKRAAPLPDGRRRMGRVDGFVIEGEIAGGHNAPPRSGQEYGPDDRPDMDEIRKTGLPFYLAGGCASPEMLAYARSEGAEGVQVGTAFAFCEESGMYKPYRQGMIDAMFDGNVTVEPDPRVSPTGYPFQVARIGADEPIPGDSKCKWCQHGELRTFYRREGSTVIDARCPGEPERVFLAKGGDPAELIGRGCLCTRLLLTPGLGIGEETPSRHIITAGQKVDVVMRLAGRKGGAYGAEAAIRYILGS